MDHGPIYQAPAASHIDGSGSSYPGLHWIIALLCFTISSYLYFCQIWCVFILLFSFFLLLVILCGLPSSRSPRWSGGWRCLGLLSHPLDPHTLHILHYLYQIFSQRKLWIMILLFCSVHLLHACPSRGNPPLWLLLRFIPSFILPLKRFFFSYYGMFFLTWIKGLMREDDVHYTDYHRFVILGYINWLDLIWFDLRDLRKKKKTAIHCDTTTEGSLIFSSLLRLLYLYCFSDLHFGKVRI